MSMKQAYIHNIQNRLNQWDADVEKLMAEADKTGADARIRYQKQIDEIKERQAEAQSRLDDMRKSSEDAWQDMKQGVEDAWDRLGKAVKDATTRFST